MAIREYVVKKGTKTRFQAKIGEEGVQRIKLQNNYVIVYKENETVSYDKINDLQTVTLYDGKRKSNFQEEQ